jgi:DNA polymerase-3 subunit epsilon
MEPYYEREQRLDATAFAVIDVETTGLNPAYGHRVCEVACLRVRGGAEEGRLESLVDPGRSISAGAYRVNRITAEMLVGAPAFGEVGGRLLALMEDALLVAHNAPFDLGFLAAELEIARLPPPEGLVVDTLALARRGYSFPSNSLGVVASHLEIEMGTAHRAMSDVQTTWRVLERMLWDLDRRWGVTTVGHLIDFQGGPIAYPLPHALPLPPALAEALEARGRVQMRYVDARGVETTREVRPLRVQEQGGNLYVLAHCFRAEALRTFRLDRVVEMVGDE